MMIGLMELLTALALTMALEAHGMGRSAAALFEYRERIVERLGR